MCNIIQYQSKKITTLDAYTKYMQMDLWMDTTSGLSLWNIFGPFNILIMFKIVSQEQTKMSWNFQLKNKHQRKIKHII